MTPSIGTSDLADGNGFWGHGSASDRAALRSTFDT